MTRPRMGNPAGRPRAFATSMKGKAINPPRYQYVSGHAYVLLSEVAAMLERFQDMEMRTRARRVPDAPATAVLSPEDVV